MAIDIDLFSYEGQQLIRQSQSIALHNNQEKVEPEHIFLAMLEAKDTYVEGIFKAMDVSIKEFSIFLTKLIPRLDTTVEKSQHPYLSKDSEKLLALADIQKTELAALKISPYHILIALSQLDGRQISSLLRAKGINKGNISAYLKSETSLPQPENSKKGEKLSQSKATTKVFDNPLLEFCSDLLEMARNNRFDPVIGRDDEVRRVIRVLSRRTKNNPILVGEPGVGKTAIIEGLAQRILAGDVPETLKNFKLISLDLGLLIAGTRYRGDFEDRLKSILKIIIAKKDQYILFIDELHNIVGAGGSEGAIDASNMLKPSLARGELRCIGATTLNEYKLHIEKDLALARRFQNIMIEEPTIQSTIGIMRGLKERYEVHHGVRIKDAAIIAAVNLSKRYIVDRFLPDKAIDLVDEAASKVRIEIDSMPVEIDEISRSIVQMEVESTALSKETDKDALNRLKLLEKDINKAKEEYKKLHSIWELERNNIQKVRKLKEEIEATKQKELLAQRSGDLETAASLKYGRLVDLEKELAKHSKFLDEPDANRVLKEEVDEDDIAEIISKSTGIPLSKMLKSEKEKLVNMDLVLANRVVGQTEAISAVCNATRRNRVGINEPDRPLGSFIFMGPTGVGKTELVKALADFLFNDEKAVIRVDMSEYSEGHSVSRLIGAPPGYVGYGSGGILTEQIKLRPYSVLLLDELEKGHRDVHNLLLQILDEGSLSDSQGFKVNFRNTIVVITSNIGSQAIFEHTSKEKSLRNFDARRFLLNHFNAELLNRIDNIIPFHNLSLSHIRQIVNLQMKELAARLHQQGITIRYNKQIEQILAEKAYDKEFGARNLKRIMQKEIEDIIAIKILDETITPGALVDIRLSDQRLSLHLVK